MSLPTEILVTERMSDHDVDLGLHRAFVPDAGGCREILLAFECGRTQPQDTSQERHHLLEKRRMTIPAVCLESLVCSHLIPEIKATPECAYQYRIILTAAPDVTL
jgi:hypothetical protein